MDFLSEVAEYKQQELGITQPKNNFFTETFSGKQAKIIAELKPASPSFDFSDRIDPYEILDFYGTSPTISGISILVDNHYFKGNPALGTYFKKHYKKPMFFKEFIVDTRQIDGASYYGYDGALLIRKMLSQSQFDLLLAYMQQKNIYPIAEVDNEKDLQEIFNHTNKSFGVAINARNLTTLEMDAGLHFRMYEKFKKEFESRTVFAFSGIGNIEDAIQYIGKYDGVLMGTCFMKNFIHEENIK